MKYLRKLLADLMYTVGNRLVRNSFDVRPKELPELPPNALAQLGGFTADDYPEGTRACGTCGVPLCEECGNTIEEF